MIHGIRANKDSFKQVCFGTGLNVVLAERLPDSGKQKTVNSRGKSTLVAIINFCLGSDASRSSICTEELSGWEFTLDISLLGRRVGATRAVDNPGRITLEGSTEGWPFLPEKDSVEGDNYFPLDKWKALLGSALFNISKSGGPSVRSLLSYFVRSGSEAYTRPLKFFANQADNVSHIYNAFFVGLNPRFASEWVDLKKRDDVLRALDRAIQAGEHESQGELEARKIELEEELANKRLILSNFKVHEHYKEIQVEANRLTSELHRLADQNVTDGHKLNHYKESIKQEKPPERRKLEQVYNEAGVVFGDTIKKTLTEAENFHEKVIRNRAAFLEAEITRIRNQIKERDRQIQELTSQRAEKMEILETHGALEEFTHLREQLAKLSERLESIKGKISDIRDKNLKRKEIKAYKLELDKEASIDYEEKRDLWEHAIKLYNESAKALYGVPGEFVIDISDKGYRFNVDIPGGRGGGIGKMKTFCYDLMVLCMQAELNRSMDFLVHDSIIFEGVDERQIAHAIEQAAQKASQLGLQYIMTINSDMVPYEDFSEEFNFESHIKLKLTDVGPSGSLLGFRY